MKWYALYVESGKEELVKKQIEMSLGSDSLRCCVPKRKVPERRGGEFSEVLKIMFPHYVFIRTEMNYLVYYKLLKIPHISYMLNYKNKKDIKASTDSEEDFFKCIPEEQMIRILKLLNPQTDTMEYSVIDVKNESIRVLAGPLVGMENCIKKIDKHKNRVKFAFDILGDRAIFDIGFKLNS